MCDAHLNSSGGAGQHWPPLLHAAQAGWLLWSLRREKRKGLEGGTAGAGAAADGSSGGTSSAAASGCGGSEEGGAGEGLGKGAAPCGPGARPACPVATMRGLEELEGDLEQGLLAAAAPVGEEGPEGSEC